MQQENWHESFNPKKFLSRVNLDRLIERNKAYNETKVPQGSSPCIFCGCQQRSGILLNDRSYLCALCFSEVSSISYPQKYEKLRRKYLADVESRKMALEKFTQEFGYSKKDSPVIVAAWFSLVLLLLHPGFLALSAMLFLISTVIEKQQNRKFDIWNAKKELWEARYPDPPKPLLRHFHDPRAELTRRDQKTLKIFNNWPGYPPFWSYLREIVLSRDGNRCQVSGCPSRVSLHVHHKTPVSKGGEHVPNNLVSLCDFHHALEPDEGHERIWGTIKTRYFTLVREHTRSNKSGQGTHHVKPHIRRLELIKLDEIKELANVYGFICPKCSSNKIRYNVNSKNNTLSISCENCHQSWEGNQQLTEETGPRIAETLNVSKNKGQWPARWDMLSSRTNNTFRMLSSAKKKSSNKPRKTIKTIASEDKPTCPKCGSPMRLISPRRGQHWKAFWGCTKYQTTGCRGSKKP